MTLIIICFVFRQTTLTLCFENSFYSSTVWIKWAHVSALIPVEAYICICNLWSCTDPLCYHIASLCQCNDLSSVSTMTGTSSRMWVAPTPRWKSLMRCPGMTHAPSMLCTTRQAWKTCLRKTPRKTLWSGKWGESLGRKIFINHWKM